MTVLSVKKSSVDEKNTVFNILDRAGDGTEIRFEKADYFFDFSEAFSRDYALSNTFVLPRRNVNLPLKNKKDLVIDFGGSTLYFDGWTMPIALEDCQNITLKNFSVDWKIPPTAEAKIIAADEKSFLLEIDEKRHPYSVKDGQLFFVSEHFRNKCWSLFEFDGDTLNARSETVEAFHPTRYSDQGNGKVLAEGVFPTPPRVGNYMTLRHGDRTHAGIFCQHCKNVVFENINLYTCCGIGFVCQFSENLTFRRVFVIPNEADGRKVMSGHDDGIQCSNCKGELRFTDCAFRGLMDDAINVHGTATGISKIDGNRITGRFMHPTSSGFTRYAAPGDRIEFAEKSTLNAIGEATVKNYRLIDNDTFEIEFTEPVSPEISENHVMENITNTPEVLCENNRFGSGRARGILITTRKKVTVRNNIFNTSGTAVLCSGDANGWYESGKCLDVTVADNRFTAHCVSAWYEFGEAVITLYPVVKAPANCTGYHKNIRITGNTFESAEKKALYALFTDGILFSGNRLTANAAKEKPFSDFIETEFCSDVCLHDNILI